jgi:hypothetical protein
LKISFAGNPDMPHMSVFKCVRPPTKLVAHRCFSAERFWSEPDTIAHCTSSAAQGGLEERNSLFDKILDYEIPTSRKLEYQQHATG